MIRIPAFLLFATLIFIAAPAKSQRLVFLFGHAEYATPTGDLKHKVDQGFGAEAGVGVGLSKTFFIATVGSTWLMASDAGTLGTLRYTPVKVGIRRYVFRRNIFIKADGGMASMKYAEAEEGSSHFTASFGAGLKFTALEVIGDYTTVSGGFGAWLSIKAGFTIGI